MSKCTLLCSSSSWAKNGPKVLSFWINFINKSGLLVYYRSYLNALLICFCVWLIFLIICVSSVIFCRLSKYLLTDTDCSSSTSVRKRLDSNLASIQVFRLNTLMQPSHPSNSNNKAALVNKWWLHDWIHETETKKAKNFNSKKKWVLIKYKVIL